MITIVDYGVGNVGALMNMFDYLGLEARVSGEPAHLLEADKLVLPGVGAFDKAMGTLRARRLLEPLNEAVLERRTPILGVCLGMQLLALRSEEGIEQGLGWIDAEVKRIQLPVDSSLKVPHIGWTDVRRTRPCALFGTDDQLQRYYFVHSYHVCCDHREDVAAVIDYGAELCCAVHHDNVYGVQFHPEKSHRFGMRLLESFANLS